MKKLILSGLLFLFAIQLFSQEENIGNSLYLRFQPLWIITHRTVPFELEYFIKPKHSLSLEYAYSGYINPDEDGLCVSCWLTDYAEKRHVFTLNYRYYIKYGFFVSPYFKYRIWYGELSKYVEETLGEIETMEIQSNSLGGGLTVGTRGKLGDNFDLSVYFGIGGYFNHSYDIKDYTISYELEQDVRLGFNIGVKLFE